MENTYKYVPFNIELAKKIQTGEIEGRIVAKTKKGYISATLKQLDIVSTTLSVYHGDNHVEIQYGHNSMLEYLQGSNLFNMLFIELQQETNKPKYIFKPFDKVLVRQSDKNDWRVAFYSHFNEEENLHVTAWLSWYQCIPYEGNEHLVGTSNNAY